jgi:hypothetical protein
MFVWDVQGSSSCYSLVSAFTAYDLNILLLLFLFMSSQHNLVVGLSRLSKMHGVLITPGSLKEFGVNALFLSFLENPVMSSVIFLCLC